MSVTTMPADGEFTVECKHCGFDTKKTPAKLNKAQELHLYFCGQCKESTLIRVVFDSATVFMVQS
jgi:hypothetical protein